MADIPAIFYPHVTTCLDQLPDDVKYIIQKKLEQPYTRDRFPKMLASCTCDSAEDSRTENLNWCSNVMHVCVCEPEPWNFKNQECRAKYHDCVCHIINRRHLGVTNYDRHGIGITGATFNQCRALKHNCFCGFKYIGGCPAHPQSS